MVGGAEPEPEGPGEPRPGSPDSAAMRLNGPAGGGDGWRACGPTRQAQATYNMFIESYDFY